MKRALVVLLLVSVLAPSAEAGPFMRRRRARRAEAFALLAEARATFAAADTSMRNATRTMRTAQAMAKDPDLKAVMAQSERLLALEVEKKKLELELLKAKAK